MPKDDKKSTYNMIVGEGTVFPIGYSQSDIISKYVFGKRVNVIEVETSEEVYRILTRDDERRHKQFQRAARCPSPTGKRCQKSNCEGCPFFLSEKKGGRNLSLELLTEDSGYEIPDYSFHSNPEAQLVYQDLLHALHAFLDTLDENERAIASAILNKMPDKEMMEKMGITRQSTYNSWKQRIAERMRLALKDYS